MSDFYTEMRQVAHSLLSEFGKTATLVNPGTGTGSYNTDTGVYTPPSSATFTVTAAVFDYEQKYIDGTFIRNGDKRALVSAVGVGSPLQGGIFQWGGVDYVVISVKPLAPALIAVLWELQVRPQ